ncbi:hypothetical protein [Mesorhizobium ventifaucium]|uniref:Porin family protein n=1 Tax=Mesorhizobium ventifaucium TaxID=666020 RepID=A0ABM9E2S5_9HYPH|nr:hypothetical protein [Mesorhizobium ventifaucium]CAH2402991.1 conserved exported hypothetical protein [Mesorhizobium ventifaucium]
MNIRETLISALAATLLGITCAQAADVAVEAPPEAPLPTSEWTFSVAPYFWGAGLQGDVGLFGREPVDIDMSFGDIFDNLRFGGMVVAEATNGTWGLVADIIYVKIEDDESVTRTVGGIPLTLAGSVETSSLTATFMGEYRAIAQPTATLDLMAGARIWSVDNDIELSLAAGGPPLAAFSGSDGSTWVDPVIGLKGRYDINASWYLTGWGIIGGFGAGSDITWDVLGGVGYQWNERFSFVAGYRALGVDYEDDGFVYDVIQHGPILGTVIRF